MNLLRRCIVLTMLAMAGIVFNPGSVHATHVALELSLMVDVSGSVSNAEYNLQRDGYRNAFLSGAVQTAVANANGGIAVNFIEWSTGQAVRIGWTHLTDAASCIAFANAIAPLTRSSNGSTGIGSAINFATPLFNNNGFESDRQVMDISGDGASNVGASVASAKAAAFAAGIDTINGLAILGEANLYNYYLNTVIGGDNAFLEVANDFNDFELAIQRKLIAEIVEVPVPGGVMLAGIGIICVMGYRRLGRKALVA